MSWDDDEFGLEYAKFREANMLDSIILSDYDGKVSVLYCEPLYNTLDDYENRWGKKRKKLRVYPIKIANGTAYKSDQIDYNENIWLDMGSRLFNQMKEAKRNKWKYVKIMRIASLTDKFDVEFYATKYNIKTQKTSDDPKVKKSNAKK